MHDIITCRPDIGYAVTALSKFSPSPSAYHYKLFQSIAQYLKSTIDWGICFKRPSPMITEESQYEENQEKGGVSRATSYSIPNDPTLTSSFEVDIDAPEIHCFVDAAYANDLRYGNVVLLLKLYLPFAGVPLCTSLRLKPSLPVAQPKLNLLQLIQLVN